MLTYSPESAYFVTLFDLVVSGLPLGALLWIRFWEKRRFPAQRALLAGFTLLCITFAAQAAHFWVAPTPSGASTSAHNVLSFAVVAARSGASLTLGAACLKLGGRSASVRLFLYLGSTVALLAALRFPQELGAGLVSIDPVTTLRFADVAILLLATTLLGWPPGLRSVALALIGLGHASGFLGAFRPELTGAAWSTGGLLELAGLILLALTLERVSEGRLLHYVLRFNLIFITLAVSLTVALAEISRRQFVEFSAMQIHDVAEFARGHLVYEYDRGKPPEAILALPSLTAGLVRDFGRYPDLRRVQLELSGRMMTLEIQPSGEIGQEFRAGTRAEPPKVKPDDFLESLLLQLPVAVKGQPLGRVALYHGVNRINAHIGQQTQVAFGVFTLFVIVGSIVTGILVHVADRTILRQDQELAEAHRRLLASERLASIGAVADGVAHEINNPAGVLVARSDYLISVIRGKSYANEIQEDLDTIRRQAQRVAKTVQDLLTSTRGARRAWAEVDITAVVDSAIKLVRPTVRDRPITFEFRQSRDLLWVWGDHDRLEQVLVNLLSNAAHAIPTRGAVTVEAALRAGGEWIDVVVTDTGIGIAPEQIGQIFNRFFTTKEAGSGSGLGLSIVSGIVRDHGGQIDVESTLGKGSRFRVALRAYNPTIDRAASILDHPPAALTDPSQEPADG